VGAPEARVRLRNLRVTHASWRKQQTMVRTGAED